MNLINTVNKNYKDKCTIYKIKFIYIFYYRFIILYNMTIIQTLLTKIIENMPLEGVKGTIMASPSNDPPYRFHWIRDSALVMRVIIHYYKQTNDPQYFQFIINYLELEYKIQHLHTLAGLGEPKINIDATPFNKPWGRPQNDGPALRIIVLWSIIDIFKGSYDYIIKQLVLPIIKKDLYYILSNYNKPSFDLWEEKLGWHFYTRMVQLYAIQLSIKNYCFISSFFIEKIVKDTYNELLFNLQDHKNGTTIISSFDTAGNISKYDDAANILAFCHIDFNKTILESFPLHYVQHNVDKLLTYFRHKYNKHTIHLIGRYQNDTYYDGQIWIICSLGLAQYYTQIGKKSLSTEILDTIILLDEDLILPEQFDPNTNIYYSAKQLTWNYSELYMSLHAIKS